MKRLFTCLLTCAAMLFCSFHAFAAEAPAYDFGEATAPIIEDTENGQVLGYRYGGVSIFKGIPYAEAERFEMPQKPQSWADKGVRKALAYSGVSPQAPTRNGQEWLSISDNWVIEEDNCLSLNIWSPDTDTEELKPVLFWLHGGGYSSGASNELEMYSGENFARDEDVVFVSINHRLNYVGYLDLSAYGDDYKYTANLGHADIIMALEWVRDNIAAFGGDPSNVTIVGQSGGGTKVTQLMGMPAAQGLFHKAVALSGGSAQVTRTTETAQADTAALVEYLGLSDKSNEEIVEALKTMPYEELRLACGAAGVNAGATVDGDFYPTGNLELSKDIPFIVNKNLGEFNFNLELAIDMLGEYLTVEQINSQIMPYQDEETVRNRIAQKYGEENVDEMIAAYGEAYPTHNPMDLLFTASRDNNLALAMAELGGTVYQSVQAYNYPVFGGFTAVHTCGDVPLWFRNIDHTDMLFWYAGDEECANKVMNEMSNALAAFCYTGNPSTADLEWVPFTVEGGETMIWDRESEIRGYHDARYMELASANAVGSSGSSASAAEEAEEAPQE